MNKVITILLLMVGNIMFSQSAKSTLNWVENYKVAIKTAEIKNKPLLIFFTGSDWCMPCKNLEVDFLKTEKFAEIAAKEFVMYKADFPRDMSLISAKNERANAKLKMEFGVSSFPTIIIINSKSEEVNRITGYNKLIGSNNHFIFIESCLTKKTTN